MNYLDGTSAQEKPIYLGTGTRTFFYLHLEQL